MTDESILQITYKAYKRMKEGVGLDVYHHGSVPRNIITDLCKYNRHNGDPESEGGYPEPEGNEIERLYKLFDARVPKGDRDLPDELPTS